MNRSPDRSSDEREKNHLILQIALVTAATLALLALLVTARMWIGIQSQELIETSWLVILALPFRDPVFLVLRLGIHGYEDWAIKDWVKRLLLVPSFRYVAFVDITSGLVRLKKLP